MKYLVAAKSDVLLILASFGEKVFKIDGCWITGIFSDVIKMQILKRNI